MSAGVAPTLRGAGPATADRVFVLEYGKPCQHEDGPIEPGSDHAHLGWSEGFPAELRPRCVPSELGVLRSGVETFPAGFPYGTVFRAVRVGDAWFSAAWRLAQRPEDGPRGRDRLYTLGRYVAAPGVASPTRLLTALGEAPRGLTREGARRSATSPAPLPPATEPDLAPALRSAFDGILAHLAAGHGVTLAGPVTEVAFFALVEALWRALPSSLRPLLSAGWGVTAAPATGLSIACGPGVTAGRAGFDVSRERWTLPAAGAREGSDGLRQRLAAGQAYAMARHGHEATTWPGWLWASPPLPTSDGVYRQDAPDVATAWRWLGARAVDWRRVLALSSWLDGAGEHEPMPSLPVFEDIAEEAGRRTLAASVAPSSRRRADALFGALSADHRDGMAELLDSTPGDDTARARLWVAAEGPADALLPALFRACRVGVAEPLPPRVLERLERVLEAGLAGGRHDLLVGYGHLFCAGSLPAPVASWLEAHDLDVVLRLHDVAPDALFSIVSAGRWEASARLEAFLRCKEGGTVVPEDRVLAADLPAEVERRWRAWLLAAWRRLDGDVASRRERLLGWTDLLGLASEDEPLLAVRRSTASLTAAALASIGDALRRRHVPDGMFPALAGALALRWDVVEDAIRASLDTWRPVLAHWSPAAWRLAFPERDGVDTAERRSPATAADRLVMRGDRLERAARRLLEEGDPGALEALRLALDCVPYATGPGPTLEALRWLGGFGPGRHVDAEPDEDFVRRWLDAAGAHASSGGRVAALAQHTTRPWQLRLLLTLWPSQDIVPGPTMLVLAARQRSWLTSHLARPGVHRDRKARFALALLPFQALDLQGARAAGWPEGLERTDLWGLFADLPVAQQGHLGRTLACFASDLEEAAALAFRYLANTPPSQRMAAQQKVASELVVPQLVSLLGRAGARKLLGAVADAGSGLLTGFAGNLLRRRRDGAPEVTRHPHPVPAARSHPEGFSLSPALHTLVTGLQREGPRGVWETAARDLREGEASR